MSEVLNKVKKILVEIIAVREAEVVPEAFLIDDLGADSQDLLSIIMALEETFTAGDVELKITDDDVDGLETVGQILDLLKAKGIS